MTLGSPAQRFHNNGFPLIDVEHHRVTVGLVCNKARQGDEHRRSQTLAKFHRPHVATRHSVTRVVKKVIHNEDQHRHNHGDTQTSFTDDGAQRCADEKEDDARQGQCKLVNHLNIMLPKQPVAITGYHASEVKLGHLRLNGTECHVHRAQFLVFG